MANENDIGGRIGLDITDFKANVAELNRQIKVIDSGFKAAAAGMEDWGKSEEGLRARIESLNKITDLQRKKVENLTEQYKKVVAEKGADSRAAQDLQIRINRETEALNKNELELKKVVAALDKFGDKAQEAAKDTDKLEKSVDEARESLKEIGGNAAKAAAAGIAAVGAAALAAIGGLLGFADAGNKAMNNFQAQTGATAEEMAEFRDIANDIYVKNLGESIDDIANSMAIVKQITGETGEALKATTERALLMRDTFGFEVRESINTVNSLMQKFGISAEQAYTLIAQGAQQGANKNGDLLDVLNEYAPHFAALGFSAEQFTDILIQGAKDGAFQVDKVGDAIKEFTIRSKDMSSSTNEAFATLGLNAEQMGADFAAGGTRAQSAFKQVLTGLSNIEDPLIRNQVGVQLFGTMFEDLEASSILALGNVQRYTNDTADTLQKINDIKYNDIGSALEGFKRQLIVSVAEPIEESLLPVVQGLVDRLKTIDVTPIINGFGWLINNAGNIAAGAAAIGAGMVTWKVISTVMGLVKVIQAWQLANEGLTVAQAALNAVMAANPIGLVITLIAALVAGIVVLWNTNEGFRNAVTAAWNAIKSTGEDVWGWLVKFFTQDIPGSANVVIDFFKNNWQEVLLFLTNPITGALKVLYNLNPRFREWVNGVWNTIVSTLRSIGDVDWAGIGRNIIDGIKNGIKNAVSGLAQSAANAAKSALSAAKRALGISSPSRVFEKEVGLQIGAGMARGISNSAKQVNAAMSGLNDKLTAQVNVTGSGGFHGGTAAGGGVVLVNVPLSLDGQILTTATSRIQLGHNRSKARALGVVPA